MSTLLQLRNRIYAQLELDEEDISVDAMNEFIREGFDRTFAAERQWPFFQSSWDVTLTAGDEVTTLPTDVGIISSLIDLESGHRLVQIAQQFAESNFYAGTGGSKPELFSVWGGQLWFWPRPSTTANRDYRLRGYRLPVWSGDDNAELDGDVRLHPAIAHYASSIAYLKLEDAEMEASYLSRWNGVLRDVERELRRPQAELPLILNGGVGFERTPRSRLWFT